MQKKSCFMFLAHFQDLEERKMWKGMEEVKRDGEGEEKREWRKRGRREK